MAKASMGEVISSLRKAKGWTQKNIADELGITDKAVSKWERDVALPDIATIPKLAELLGVSVEELLQAKVSQLPAVREAGRIVNSILKVVPLTMGVMVPVAMMLDILDVKIGFCMMGLGVACIGAFLLKEKK